MNLYLAGWNLTEKEQDTATRCLQEISRDYPSLDADSAWRTPAGAAFAACVHSDAAVSGSRQYLYQQSDEVVLFDGCMVDVDGQMDAMRAGSLASHWDDLPARLEGVFSAVRIQYQVPSMEVVTDPLGMAQVFYAMINGKLVISNSVRVLTRLCGDSSLDPLGSSLMLCLGWVSGDCTLNRAVKIMPGGSRWLWKGNAASEPIRNQYYSRANLVLQDKTRLRSQEVHELGDQLTSMLGTLGDNYKLQCPLTGGRDSRLMLSLLLRDNLSADIYTDASTGEADLNCAINVARELQLPHRIYRPNIEISDDLWQRLVVKLVRQNDGMVSLWQLADVMPEEGTHPEMPIRFNGLGGEIARRYYADPTVFLLGGKDLTGAAKWLAGQVLHSHGGIVSEGAMLLGREFLNDWVSQMAESGFRVTDLPDCFYTFERVRRWAGGNSRKVQESMGWFAPMCTRPFVETAFRVPVWGRYSESVHYQLIKLHPKLHRLPFGGSPWLSQVPGLALPQLIVRRKMIKPLAKQWRPRPSVSPESMFDIHKVIDAKRHALQTFCLDQASSSIWDYVDRDRFEQVTSPNADTLTRASHIDILCQIATLFYYEAFQDEIASPSAD